MELKQINRCTKTDEERVTKTNGAMPRGDIVPWAFNVQQKNGRQINHSKERTGF